MKKALMLVAVVAMLVAAIPAFAATKTVTLKDNFFQPKTLTVKKGTTLVFRFAGRAPHNVKGAGISSPVKRSGTYRARARRSGTLVCTIHSGMKMRLRVR